MNQPTLYLMMGFPGAGKTTAAKIIAELTNATHLWADHIRRERIKNPTYSHSENQALYKNLNQETAAMLKKGQSVVFDTNFNFYRDREHLRTIASNCNAQCKLIWIQTPKPIAKSRAVDEPHLHKTRVLGAMPEDQFLRLSNQLETPKDNEKVIVLDGTKLTPKYIVEKLEI